MKGSLVSSGAEAVPRGAGEKITWTFQRYVILDLQEQWTGLLKVEIDLC